MNKPIVVISHWVHPETTALLSPHGNVIQNDTRESLSPEELLARAREATALMAFMPDRVDEAFLRECPKLKIVAGALKGFDNLDTDACAGHKVWVSIVPDLLTVPTAELAVGLLLAVSRRVAAGDARVRSGEFQGWRPVLYGEALAGRTVGILGFGKVGQTIARRLSGFDVQLCYCDPGVSEAGAEVKRDPRRVSLEELLAKSDHLILAAPLTPSTFHLLDRSALERVKGGACVVNVGRGSVVDEEAVAQALSSGQLSGYAADVFEMEDLSLPERPRSICRALLEQRERTVFTPHLGSAVKDVRKAIERSAAENIIDVLEGRAPRNAVNSDLRGA